MHCSTGGDTVDLQRKRIIGEIPSQGIRAGKDQRRAFTIHLAGVFYKQKGLGGEMYHYGLLRSKKMDDLRQ